MEKWWNSVEHSGVLVNSNHTMNWFERTEFQPQDGKNLHLPTRQLPSRAVRRRPALAKPGQVLAQRLVGGQRFFKRIPNAGKNKGKHLPPKDFGFKKHTSGSFMECLPSNYCKFFQFHVAGRSKPCHPGWSGLKDPRHVAWRRRYMLTCASHLAW